VDQWIRPALHRGAVVLSDRFTDSTLAYQGGGRGLGAEVVMTIHRIACREINPDLTICIDIDLNTSLERAHQRNRGISDKDERRIDEETVEFHKRVREAYLELASREPHRILVIDGRADRESVAAKIWEAVKDRV
jgi:dTMP kinase